MKLWSENIGGNLHQMAVSVNEMGWADKLVIAQSTGMNTVCVFRVSNAEYAALKAEQAVRNKNILGIGRPPRQED